MKLSRSATRRNRLRRAVHWHGRFVQATGFLLAVVPEPHPVPDLADHLYLEADCGAAGKLRFALNTRSRRNQMAGFDHRVRMARHRASIEVFPAPGLELTPLRDYEGLERTHNLFYETFEQAALETLMIDEAKSAVMTRAWGIHYQRGRQGGVHQLHSRRASCAVPEEVRGMDGGLALYHTDPARCTFYCFKFCGQP